MFGKVMRAALAGALGLVVAVSGLTVPALAAGEDKGLCNENHARGTIPATFPLDVCFDGTTLYLKNSTDIPLSLTLIGDSVGKPERYTRGGEGASRLLDFIQPATFSRQPQINAPHFRSGVVPPKYYVKVATGNGEVKVRSDAASREAQRYYVIAKAVWDFMPAGASAGIVKAVVDLIRELYDVGDQHFNCLKRNTNAWGDLACQAVLSRNVLFAYGRAAINGLGKGLVQAVMGVFNAAAWANDAVGDRIDIKKAAKEFTLAAVKAPAQPTTKAPQPPAGNQGGGNSGGNSGGGGNNPPGNNQPPPQYVATIQNKHLEGGSGLGEDSTPAYLSTVMQPRCASNGCKIGGTDMWSGATFKAICRGTGAMMTNENRNRPEDDHNPHRIDTTSWMYGEVNGKRGWVSFIYLTPASRNLGVPAC